MSTGKTLNLVLNNQENREHPFWDSTRVYNDIEFATLIYSGDIEEVYNDNEDIIGVRPVDNEEIKKQIMVSDWNNKERYLYLLLLLETDTKYWLDIGFLCLHDMD